MQTRNDYLFLYDPTLSDETIEKIRGKIEGVLQAPLFARPYTADGSMKKSSFLFLMISDDDFIQALPRLADQEKEILILPYEGNPDQQRYFTIPSSIDDALDLATNGTAAIASYTRCNDRPTLKLVTIGTNSWARREGITSLTRLFSTHLRGLAIETAKGQTIKTAALTVEAGGENRMDMERAYFFSRSDNRCRRIAAVVYAPKSILQALKLRTLLTLRQREEAQTLPSGIGTLKSRSLRLLSSDGAPLTVCIGEERFTGDSITLESVTTQARFLTTAACQSGDDEKESIRVQNIPTNDEEIDFFVRRSLPMVPIAEESAFAELFSKLRESAVIHRAYLLLLIVSVLMATTGLFQNSAPTIIGAMILAPLMAPIIAFSMGAIRFDTSLIARSSKTILLSILIALGSAALLAWWMPFSHVTAQMSLRTHPTLLDLAVAILAGIAAAYGYANSKVGESLAGVAIAVALVPPLCVSGIGIGWLQWHLFIDAFLLFLANIAGIVVASGAMFYLMGFASRRYASAAFVVKLSMVAVIAIPLWLSTRTLVQDQRIYRDFAAVAHIQTPFGPVENRLVSIRHDHGRTYVVVDVTSSHPLDRKAKSFVARRLKKVLGDRVLLVLDFAELY